jgi:hypothetical protein
VPGGPAVPAGRPGRAATRSRAMRVVCTTDVRLLFALQALSIRVTIQDEPRITQIRADKSRDFVVYLARRSAPQRPAGRRGSKTPGDCRATRTFRRPSATCTLTTGNLRTRMIWLLDPAGASDGDRGGDCAVEVNDEFSLLRDRYCRASRWVGSGTVAECYGMAAETVCRTGHSGIALMASRTPTW